MQLLTPYAFTFVLKQINCSSKVKLVINGDTFEGKNSAGSIVVAEETCTCSFWKTMQLQRRHIFALHSIKKLSLYHASLCALQWTQFYYKSNYNIADIEGYDQGDSGCMISAVSCKKAKRVTVLAQQDKYRKASHITTKLASLVSEAPMREFKQKLSTLEDILKVWKQGGRCTIQECEGQLYVAYYIIYGVICNSNRNSNRNDYMILV